MGWRWRLHSGRWGLSRLCCRNSSGVWCRSMLWGLCLAGPLFCICDFYPGLCEKVFGDQAVQYVIVPLCQESYAYAVFWLESAVVFHGSDEIMVSVLLVSAVPHAGNLCLPGQGDLPVLLRLAAAVYNGDFPGNVAVPGCVDFGGNFVPGVLLFFGRCMDGLDLCEWAGCA